MSDEMHRWTWKRATAPSDVMHFLNGSGAYGRPVKDAKVSAVRRGGRLDFHVFYRRRGSEIGGGWGWKRATDPRDVKEFLSGTGPYERPVGEARICSAHRADRTDFYVFYRRPQTQRPLRWGWKKATSADDVADFLNGSGAYRRPVRKAEICVARRPGHLEFHVFYLRGRRGQPADNWSWSDLANPQEVRGLLNRSGDLPSPVRDGKLVACTERYGEPCFYAFAPQPFLVVSRPLFDDPLEDFIRWKESTGFEVHVVTAEWIRDHIGGDDLRLKIRNTIRAYRSALGLRYGMLVGDSVDIVYEDEEPPSWQEPPEPVLSEAWNLPAGYYRFDCWNRPQYTTLYWADTTDKVHYPVDESYYTGTYEVAVGVVPVREPRELENVVAKLRRARPASRLTTVYSEDLFGDVAQEKAEAIAGLAGPGLATELLVFGEDDAAEEVYAALFERPGAIVEHGHGNVSIFVIGGTVIHKEDAARFLQVNPLYLLSSCLVQTYHLGECLDEAFLKRRRGPAVISTAGPRGAKPAGVVLSPQEQGFWSDLFAGRSIGRCFYGHSHGAYKNPQHLFGDPSLVICAT